MSYVEGFVLAVPADKKDAYLKHARDAAPLFKEFGVVRMVETWGDDVPDGKVTDFKRAVKAAPQEAVLFSWFEYPDKAARDAAVTKMMSDPRMKEIGASMPFDGQRMIFAGFAVVADTGRASKPGYVDGSVIAVPAANKDAFLRLTAKHAALFQDYGATRVVDAWGDDVPDGKVTDFKGAVQATAEENIAYGWIEWPSKAVRDAGWQKIMADPRMQPGAEAMPFDGKRMLHGGFQPILDL